MCFTAQHEYGMQWCLRRTTVTEQTSEPNAYGTLARTLLDFRSYAVCDLIFQQANRLKT